MQQLQNLLQNVAMIQKKYDDLAEYSGEHYNVFDILGVRSDELSHSAILANLLNANGKHGQKDIFLELFIEQIKPYLEKSRYSDYIVSFDTKKALARKEIHLGGINSETAEGGRADIVVSSGNKHLVIENKIYAGDQDQQLLRYDNHYKNDPIIYLTRFGVEPSPASSGNLVLGTDFICISYHTDISNWLEKCIKEMANKPFIRETLNQYLFLIKSLTNQSNNDKMSEEIINLVLKNDENFETAITLKNTLNIIYNKLDKKLDEIAIACIEDQEFLDNKLKNSGFSSFKFQKFKDKGKSILDFQFFNNENNFNNVHIQLTIIDYKIQNKIWCLNKTLEATLKTALLQSNKNYDLNYDFHCISNEIYCNVKSQIDDLLRFMI